MWLRRHREGRSTLELWQDWPEHVEEDRLDEPLLRFSFVFSGLVIRHMQSCNSGRGDDGTKRYGWMWWSAFWRLR